MNKFNISLLCLVLTQVLYSQKQINIKDHYKQQILSSDIKPEFTSPRVALLMSDINKKSFEELKKKYPIRISANNWFVGLLIDGNEKLDVSRIKGISETYKKYPDNKYTISLPVDNLSDLTQMEGIRYIELSENELPELDSTLSMTRVNPVHLGTDLTKEYSGEGVIIGIVDGGLDYTHPTFYSADKSVYRISRVWEQESEGTPPAGFDYGNELVGQTQILNKENDGIDRGSHGTHVAGIASGSGATLADSYRGVAYKSEVVLVATNYNTTGIVEGMDYIFSYAESQNKPAAINLSLGSQWGPHDGTSVYDQIIDSFTGEGKILTKSAGNGGNELLHINHSFVENDTIYSFIEFPDSENKTNGATSINIWGEANIDFQIAVAVYNIDANEYEDYTGYISTSKDSIYNIVLEDNDPLLSDTCEVKISVESRNLYNQKPNVVVEFDNTDQNESDDIYDYVLLELVGSNFTIDAWLIRDGEFTNLTYASPVIDGNNVSTITRPGNGNSVITVGAYTSKNKYYDITGDLHSYSFTVGDIAYFSSRGPTTDGRIKPDITAPGSIIVSSVNSFDTKYSPSSDKVVDEITDGETDWYFAALQGTSMASPVAAGIIALLLEANPTLTPGEIKTLLQDFSQTDTYTGSVPNNIWGSGKIDAYEMIKQIKLSSTLEIQESDIDIILYPNPSNGIISIKQKHEDNLKYHKILIFDALGRLVYNEQVNTGGASQEIDLSFLNDGLYFIQFTGRETSKHSKIIISR